MRPRESERTGQHRGIASPALMLGGVAALAVTAGFFLLRPDQESATSTRRGDMYAVDRGGFDITVPASGELAAKDIVTIVSAVEGQAAIVSIVDEGTFAKVGDLLVEFDATILEDERQEEKLEVDNAESRLVASAGTLATRQESSALDIELAEQDVELANLALEEWRDGANVTQLKSHQLELETSEKDYLRLESRYERSVRLFADNFISEDELKRDEIDLIRARSRYEQATKDLEVYEKYTTVAQQKRLEAEVKRSVGMLKELRQRVEIELGNLRRDVANKQYNLDNERADLAEVEEQIVRCKIAAPRDGLVVYVSSLSTGGYGRRDDRQPPMVGTQVRFREPIMILPDTSAMVAEVKVNEAQSGKIRTGQRATVYSDALPDQALEGVVEKVAVLAESGGWRDPNRRDYTIHVKLNNIGELGLKPSMRCKADLHVGRVVDALFVPVQAIFREGPVAYVYVADGAGYAATPVTLGQSSDLYIEVDGIEQGRQVLLRKPAAEQITKKIETSDDGAPWSKGGGVPRGAGGSPSRAGGPQKQANGPPKNVVPVVSKTSTG